MSNFFQKKYFKDETALIFSIESGEITSTLVRYEKEKKPLILYVKTHIINTQNQDDISHLLPVMLLTLRESAEDVLYRGFKEYSHIRKQIPIENVYVFLGAPWYKASTLEKNISSDKQFLLTSEIIDKGAEELFAEVSTTGFHVEKKVISIKANGYNIENPIGHKVTSALITAYVASSEQIIVDKIKEIIHLSFPNFEVHFHTISIALYSMVTRLMPNSNFILMLPEHKVTEFVLVSKKNIDASVSIPFGRHHLVESIAKDCDSNLFEAHSLLKLWREKKLSENKVATIDTALKNAKEEWFTLLRNAFVSLSKFSLLPSAIVVSGKTLESDILAEWTLQEEYSNQTFTLNKFSVLFLTRSSIDALYDSKIPKENVGTIAGSIVLFLRAL